MHIHSSIELGIGLLLLAGLVASILSARFNIPRVAAYLCAGILFSDQLLGSSLHIHSSSWGELLTDISLSIIAFIIGGSMTIPQMRRVGRVVIGSAIGAALLAMICVFTVISIYAYFDDGGVINLTIALALATIATTTAPAGTVAVLHQYRAQGPITNAILGIVALDDALGILLFSFMLVIIGNESFFSSVTHIFNEVFGAVIFGALMGWVMAKSSKLVRQSKLRLPMIVGFILVSLAISNSFNFSQLLTLMSLGFFVRYFLGSAGDKVFSTLEYFEEFVFIIFFTLAGTHFNLNIFTDYFFVIILYFIARAWGKIKGAQLGASFAKPLKGSQWIGYGLIPQAGVAVGLTLTLSYQPGFEEISFIILNIIIANTLLSEISGPFFTKYGLQKTGELGIKRRSKRQ